ncbi:G-type lectin S-receptor-like serine/threonine-protein kinase [Raphanus sativus]|uniref:Receptor-like serine/threonine-protein kinase n=1 Tax=Raphanus sativus TaxID=3726 RepID=A0A6J0K5V9_RAPSA|nr:G-type lectin S-receptor-like serine/threonine-protein kinase At4g11900 isoform X2 [Raphanus sativus]KAJ4867575.1 G-type lectin S-receptor-like serine/threonine-protein kinase [Raphanus sativus]
MNTFKGKKLFFISTYGFLMMFLPLQVSYSSDTILTNQSLSGFETIVSRNGVFELGLFSPGISSLFYLGIWYKQIVPKTIVWVANQESPVPKIAFVNLSLSLGSLVLYDNYTELPIWWSASIDSNSSADVQAVLLDSGNLILRDGPTSSAAVLWQSFDYPSDTWLPGAKIRWNTTSKFITSWNTLEDPSPGRYSLQVDPITRKSLIILLNETKSYWSSGAWDDRRRIFKKVTARNLSFEFNLNESYVTYSVRYQNPFRLVMDVSGQLTAYNWLEKHQMWDASWSAPDHKCEVYGYCGSFGICYENSSCKCAPTFRPAYIEGIYIYSNDSSAGCVSEINLATNQCGKETDKFLPLYNIKAATDPDPNPDPLEDTPLTTTCESTCLGYCFCKAYAYDGNRCLIWTSNDIFNLQQLDANNSEGRTFYVRLVYSDYISKDISSDISNKGRRNHRKVRTLMLAVLLPLLVVAALSISLYCYCFSSPPRSKRAQKDKEQSKKILEGGIIDAEVDDQEQMLYLNLLDIMAATNAFSEENKLGEGGFGPVYKENLPNGTHVAIKRLSKKSSQGLIEFKNEVVLIIKLQHKNLVKLLGYCVEGDEKLLIYEYMSNKSLDALLFDTLKSKELDWEKRMKIITGTTKGLQYLHEDSRLKIIHRDLKASNILLDDEMNPKISGFGAARIFGCKQIDDSTQRIVGTFGYMSPEYALGGMISEKSDIYSFGVLLLEIVSGKKATRFVHDRTHSIIAYAWGSWCETKGVSIIDESLGDSYSLKEVMRCVHIALLCVQDHPKDRPTISQIVYMLSNDHDLRVPIPPTFTNVLNCNHGLPPSDYVFSINEATQSTMEGR